MNPSDPRLKRPETRAWMNLSVYQPSSRFNEKAFLKETILRGIDRAGHPASSFGFCTLCMHTVAYTTQRYRGRAGAREHFVFCRRVEWEMTAVDSCVGTLETQSGPLLGEVERSLKVCWLIIPSSSVLLLYACGWEFNLPLFFYSGHLSPCFCFIIDSSVISVTFAEKLMSVQPNSNHQTNHTINKASLATHRHFTHLIVFIICPIKSSICQTYLS